MLYYFPSKIGGVKFVQTYVSMFLMGSTTCSTIFMHNGITFRWIKTKRAKVPTNGIFEFLQILMFENLKP